MNNNIIKIVSSKNEKTKQYIKNLKNREEEVQKETIKSVESILNNIKEKGDNALVEYTNKFDSKNINLDNLLVTDDEIKRAYEDVEESFVKILKEASCNIELFHKNQKTNSWMMTKENGAILGQQIRALKKVGIYVPGGTAVYPSSVLMNAIPAKVAGTKEIIMVTPPSKNGTINPNILVAAHIAGVNKIFKLGGAQAIGALAFGTKSVDKVDKIVGPGNIYVAMAKKLVYGNVDIDMIAGPSEILILADEKANPAYIAADLMSQAEHDILASSILVTTSELLANKVIKELEYQIKSLKRQDIIKKSLKDNGLIIIVDSISHGIEISNEIAPEHMELYVENPFSILGNVENAGSIFMGEYTPEPVGDYFAGPNHVLPTGGTARFYSPLSVDDFVKKSSFINYSKNALLDDGEKIIKFAETEGLTAHANSIKVRLQKEGGK